MSEPLLTFQRFNDIGLATEFADKLTELGIYCEIDNQTVPFDVSYANNPLTVDIRLKIRQSDFDKANTALDDYYKGQLNNINKDYYLFSFTDEELEEIVKKPDEWNRLDYQLALQLLKERGIEVNPQEIEQLHNERNTELAKTEKTPSIWIFAGYIPPFITILAGLNVLGLGLTIYGSFVGVFLGVLLAFNKKTLPDGRRVYMYAANQRLHGKIIMWLNIASVAFWYISIMGRYVFNL